MRNYLIVEVFVTLLVLAAWHVGIINFVPLKVYLWDIVGYLVEWTGACTVCMLFNKHNSIEP